MNLADLRLFSRWCEQHDIPASAVSFEPGAGGVRAVARIPRTHGFWASAEKLLGKRPEGRFFCSVSGVHVVVEAHDA